MRRDQSRSGTCVLRLLFLAALGLGSLLQGCSASSPTTGNGGSGGGGTVAVTPSVTVTPSAPAITTAQKLSVTVSVTGSGAATPAGAIVLSSGSYASAATTLSASGSAIVTVPAGLLLTGNDTLSAAYTPSTASASTYNQATGTGTVSVTSGGTIPTVMATPATYATQSAPFQAIVSPTGTVFVAESGGVEVFSSSSGAFVSTCVNQLSSTLLSEGGALSELSYLPNGLSIAAGAGSPGAIFYNAAALANCSATGLVVSQGALSADEGTQAVAVTPNGNYAFVSNEYGVAAGATTEGNVGVVSLQYDASGNVTGGTLLGQISTGGTAIAGMLLSPDGTRLYVTSEIAGRTQTTAGGSNPVLGRTGCVQQVGGAQNVNGILTVIDVATAEASPSSSAILTTVAAGCSPVRMAETADNSTLWVAVRGDNRVLAFSTGMLEVNPANALLGYADTGGTAPVGITLFRNQTLLAVANSNRFGAGPVANATILSVAYPPAPTLVQTVTTGLFPREVTDGPDDATLYLTDYDSDTLEVISTH